MWRSILAAMLLLWRVILRLTKASAGLLSRHGSVWERPLRTTARAAGRCIEEISCGLQFAKAYLLSWGDSETPHKWRCSYCLLENMQWNKRCLVCTNLSPKWKPADGSLSEPWYWRKGQPFLTKEEQLRHIDEAELVITDCNNFQALSNRAKTAWMKNNVTEQSVVTPLPKEEVKELFKVYLQQANTMLQQITRSQTLRTFNLSEKRIDFSKIHDIYQRLLFLKMQLVQTHDGDGFRNRVDEARSLLRDQLNVLSAEIDSGKVYLEAQGEILSSKDVAAFIVLEKQVSELAPRGDACARLSALSSLARARARVIVSMKEEVWPSLFGLPRHLLPPREAFEYWLEGAQHSDFKEMRHIGRLGAPCRSVCKVVDAFGVELCRYQDTNDMGRLHSVIAVLASPQTSGSPRLYGFFHSDSLSTVLTHYLPGETLQHWIEQGQKERLGTEEYLKQVLYIVRSLLTALSFFHVQGIAHGAVSKSSVILGGAREVTLCAPVLQSRDETIALDMTVLSEIASELFGLDFGLIEAMRDGSLKTAIDALKHPVFSTESSEIRFVPCDSCMESFEVSEGASCTLERGGHFMCDQCFLRRATVIVDSGGASTEMKSNVTLTCHMPQCENAFDMQVLVAHLPKQLSKSLVDIAMNRAKGDHEREIEERHRKEMAAAFRQNIQMIAQLIVDDILTLKCPNGHAYVDFDGCLSLSCATCNVFFCACCHKPAENSQLSHAHVHKCEYNPNRSFFASGEEIQVIQREIKRRGMDKILIQRNLNQEERNALQDILAPALQDAGLDNYPFLM